MKSNGLIKSLSDNLIQAFDLSEQLGAALQAIAGVAQGATAWIHASALMVVASAMGYLAWYFDYSATVDYAQPIIERVAGSLPPDWGLFVAAASWVITVAPTLIEMFFPRLSRTSFVVAFCLYACLCFDAATDSPRVIEVLGLYGDAFGNDLWGGLMYVLAYAILLLFSTIGFELLFVVSLVCSIYLFLRG